MKEENKDIYGLDGKMFNTLPQLEFSYVEQEWNKMVEKYGL
jgi:hypothetical protein